MGSYISVALVHLVHAKILFSFDSSKILSVEAVLKQKLIILVNFN